MSGRRLKFSVLKQQHPVTDVEHAFVVSDDDDPPAVMARLGDEQLHDPAPVLEIEARSRFIGQQEPRPIDEGTGDGDTLPFAARQVPRQLIEAMT